MLPKLTLVLGGAASGKSAFAETLVKRAERSLTYFATAQIFDDEMRDKVSRHKATRGEDWYTIEEPLEVGAALAKIDADQAVLLDCATMWLSNHLLAENDIAKAESALFDGLAQCPAPVIVVSNEVGLSVVPENALARRFRQAQGELNQKLAAEAELVVNVIAGLPQVLKGTLP
ncbi:bifunctional adenosylcobinamide kinase/adenosylcobinamide-phosphate guanylyltransferase [Roseovarius sp. A21]|uniref:Bifunctional adenosylcobalamin biosynthesis protein n=1 Tax=Roseovarius bejariae TaxID=2576383 RepID=A0A844CT73_9RHOB|nr:bifunctional adenosylcobinamide kinase/adenosylcobinamide-phosphate guanylyltransferase [Roseovarius bejariae]MRU15199.1 bifunctional adenosylcobinamide kinase/adenosylcobinamide-phosphate guanylyltransferase [Roseovarius bejariae]